MIKNIWRKSYKTKSYNNNVTTIFDNVDNDDDHDHNNNNNKVPKEGSDCICPSAIVTDSVFKSGKNH